MSDKTEVLTPPNNEFASWRSVDGRVHRLRIVDDGKPIPYLIGAAFICAMAEMSRGGNPTTVLDSFGPSLNFKDANHETIWPVPKEDRADMDHLFGGVQFVKNPAAVAPPAVDEPAVETPVPVVKTRAKKSLQAEA